MNIKFLKVFMSTVLIVPFIGTSVLANSDTSETDQAVQAKSSSVSDNPDSAMADTSLNAESEKNQDAESREDYPTAVYVMDTGASGVHWYIDQNYILYFEAGEMKNEVSWKYYSDHIHEIIVIPNDHCDKLILPEDSNSLFSGLSSLTDIDPASFDTSRVASMENMFSGCTGLKDLDLSSWNINTVKNMQRMFSGCTSLKSVRMSGFNTSTVRSISGMFSGCQKLEQIDIPFLSTSDDPLNTESESRNQPADTDQNNISAENSESDSKPKYAVSFDYGNSGVDWFIDQDNTLYVEAGPLTGSADWADYSDRIRKIRVIPNEHCRNLILPEDSDHLFYNFSSLTDIDSACFDTSNVSSMSKMFAGCSSLQHLDLSSFETGNVRTMADMFSGCTNLADLNLSSFDTSAVRSLWGMFKNCSSLKSLDLSGFVTSSVTDMAELFYGCSSLKDVNLSSFDTSAVWTFRGMFAGCSSLQFLDLLNFNTENCSNMDSMFEDCLSLKDVVLISFQTPFVSSFRRMFAGCHKLTHLDLSGFDTVNVTGSQGIEMLYGCTSLRKVRISNDFFNGNMTYSCPFTQQTKWIQDTNPRIVKTWTEMIQTSDEGNAGCWNLVHHSSLLAFDTNGGTEIIPLPASTGSRIDLTSYIPDKTGYTFTGWYYDPECTEKTGDLLTLNSDITLYAGWQIQNRTLTFDTNGGIEMSPFTCKFGSTVDTWKFFPDRFGYAFTGWYYDPECTDKVDDQIALYSNTTLYAGWDEGPFWLEEEVFRRMGY